MAASTVREILMLWQTRVTIGLAADILGANKGASDPLRLQVVVTLVEALLRREIARLDAQEQDQT
jgi:hypothetical protein